MTMEARLYSGEKTVSSISGAGKTGQLHLKEYRILSNTIHKNKIKMVKDLNVRQDSIKS